MNFSFFAVKVDVDDLFFFLRVWITRVKIVIAINGWFRAISYFVIVIY